MYIRVCMCTLLSSTDYYAFLLSVIYAHACIYVCNVFTYLSCTTFLITLNLSLCTKHAIKIFYFYFFTFFHLVSNLFSLPAQICIHLHVHLATQMFFFFLHFSCESYESIFTFCTCMYSSQHIHIVHTYTCRCVCM